MKKIRLIKIIYYTIIILMIAIGLNQNTNAFAGCVADDPGECVASCQSGSICCVGYSPNCSESMDGIWINCGQGSMRCSENLE